MKTAAKTRTARTGTARRKARIGTKRVVRTKTPSKRAHWRTAQATEREQAQLLACLWTPAAVLRAITVVTACLCLVIYVAGVFWLLREGILAPTLRGATSGTGLFGLGKLVVKFLKIAFGPSWRIG
jgi:hypothetical protein